MTFKDLIFNIIGIREIFDKATGNNLQVNIVHAMPKSSEAAIKHMMTAIYAKHHHIRLSSSNSMNYIKHVITFHCYFDNDANSGAVLPIHALIKDIVDAMTIYGEQQRSYVSLAFNFDHYIVKKYYLSEDFLAHWTFDINSHVLTIYSDAAIAAGFASKAV